MNDSQPATLPDDKTGFYLMIVATIIVACVIFFLIYGRDLQQSTEKFMLAPTLENRCHALCAHNNMTFVSYGAKDTQCICTQGKYRYAIELPVMK